MHQDDQRRRGYPGESDYERAPGGDYRRSSDPDWQRAQKQRLGGRRGASPYFDEGQETGRYESGGRPGAYRERGAGGDYGRMSSPGGDNFGDEDRYHTGRGYGGHGGYGEYGRHEGADYERAGRSQWGGYEGNDFRGRPRTGAQGPQPSISQYGGGYGDFGWEGEDWGRGANPSRQGSGYGGSRPDQMAQQGGYEWGDDFGAAGGMQPDWRGGGGRGGMGRHSYPSPSRRTDMPRSMPKNYQRTDERIQEDVCEQLSRSGLDVSDISVNVAGGHVTLEGTVHERFIKHAIEDCVDDCSGVQDIDNRIRVQRQSSGAASQGAASGGREAQGQRAAENKGRTGK